MNPSFIEVYPDAMNAEGCAEVIKEAVSLMDALDNGGDEVNTTSTRRRDNCVFMNNHKMPVSHAVHQSVIQPLTEFKQKWDILGPVEMASFDCKVQMTPPGGGYHEWHAENVVRQHMDRVLTWMLYLNDEFEGGETEFLYQNMRVAPKTGTLVMWPAAFTHTHRGNPPIGGEKWVATGWWFHRA